VRKHLRQGYYWVFRILNVDTQAGRGRSRFKNRSMCDPQRHCQGASLRSKQLTFVAAIALTFDMGICFRSPSRLPVRCAQQFTITRSTRLRQYRDELNQEFHLIKLLRHADSYSYLLLNYNKRLIGNKFPRVVFPQAGPRHARFRTTVLFLWSERAAAGFGCPRVHYSPNRVILALRWANISST
jgi:hypothetical protein